MRYDYETYKAQAHIYQAKGAESQLGEAYASNQHNSEGRRRGNLLRLIRTWFYRLLALPEVKELAGNLSAAAWKEEEEEPLQNQSRLPAMD
jgi:hypothetical protein